MKGTWIALDVGTRTIGLAKADDRSRLPSTWFTLSREGVKTDVRRLVSSLAGETIAGFVVGMPYELDGGEGRSARLARQIGEALAAASGVEVHYQDERYSTVEAERRLRERGITARDQRHMIDQAAAAVILEDFFAGL